MSNETFSVGEIAILQNLVRCAHDNGTECEITALPRPVQWIDTDGKSVHPGCYVIWQYDQSFEIEPSKLRKRRPPQDWVKLCNLTDVPREVAHV